MGHHVVAAGVRTMSQIQVPKLRVPFQIAGKRAAIVEQDTPDEIGQCVAAILRTPVGSRVDEPEFGIDELTFGSEVDSAALLQALDEWEPRASVEFEIDDIIDMHRTVDVLLNTEELSSGE